MTQQEIFDAIEVYMETKKQPSKAIADFRSVSDGTLSYIVGTVNYDEIDEAKAQIIGHAVMREMNGHVYSRWQDLCTDYLIDYDYIVA